MQETLQNILVEITVREEPSPIVEIVLKDGSASVFTTKLSFPNMERAEEYAQHMAKGMGVTSYYIISSSQPSTGTCAVLIELSSEDFDSILKYATETSPIYARLKNSIKIATDTFAIPCDISEAEMVRDIGKQFSPQTVSKINAAIRDFRRLNPS